MDSMAENATQEAPNQGSQPTNQGNDNNGEVKLNFPDAVAEVTFKQIIGLTKQHNEQVGMLNAVKGDPYTLIESLRESSQDPTAVKIRAELEKVREREFKLLEDLDKAIKPEYEETRKNAEGKAEAIEKDVSTLRGKIDAATKYYRKMYDPDGSNFIKHLPKVQKTKGGGGGSGSATGGRRIRGFDFTVSDPKQNDGKPTTYENAAQVAKAVNVETETLQAGFFEKAGNVESSKDAPDTVEWTVHAGKDDNAREVKIVANRKKAEESESGNEQAPATNESAA